MEHVDVVPDVLVFAKGIASGMPLSGFATRQELSATQAPGSMGGTYAGITYESYVYTYITCYFKLALSGTLRSYRLPLGYSYC